MEDGVMSKSGVDRWIVGMLGVVEEFRAASLLAAHYRITIFQ